MWPRCVNFTQGQAALALSSNEQVVPGGAGQAGDVRVQVGSNYAPPPPAAAGDDHATLYSDTGTFELVGDEYTG